LRRPSQGAQEISVPVKNGCSPDAPEGGHSAHAGALLDGAVAAVAKDPRETAAEDGVAPALPSVLEFPPEEATPPADPLPEPPVVVVPAVDGVDAAGFARIGEDAAGLARIGEDAAGFARIGEDAAGFARIGEDAAALPVPSATTPLLVTPPGVAVVCATAGKATVIKTNNAHPIRGAMIL
jgi:hypothetical protein